MSYQIEYLKGDLFTDYDISKKTVLVHGCNAQGVMGSGVAKTFKELYPEAFTKYVKDTMPIIYDRQHMVGTVSFYEQTDKLLLASAITQENYGKVDRRYVSYDGVNRACLTIFENAIKHKHEQIVFPLIGAGLGGGDWNVIRACINSAASESLLPPEIKLICFVQEQWMVNSYGKF